VAERLPIKVGPDGTIRVAASRAVAVASRVAAVSPAAAGLPCPSLPPSCGSPTFRSSRSVSRVPFPCPCCGYETLPGPSPTDEICEVCLWQDDFVDNHDTHVLGPNSVTLSEARVNFVRCGASEQRWVEEVREPRPDEGPPQPWTETRTTLEERP
jgi:Cysteine-rich CPCC